MEHKKVVIRSLIVLVGIVLIVGILYTVFRTGEQIDQNLYNQEVAMTEPIDVVLDFYDPWLEAVQSTSTDPYTSGLAAKKILSEALRTRLMSTAGHADTEIDPVLCQTTTPMQTTGRIVSEQEDTVRVLVMARDKTLTAQSVFTLKRHNNGWFIEDILCSPGEFGLPREFSFESEGHLLKSVPPPFDPQYWHIVFEENGKLGHVAPLFFGTESSCVSIDKTDAVCVPEQFMEATKIHVYGQMTERGVEVTRLEFIE